ncbi:hypothetical protein GCM10009630_07850 [Kribbella jejuensis]|uniref:Uncharacterized protein n=1 Tax=Kribbella jejuensis TaxID=236068 RepID=A0A542EVR9_9ACTN|nr:hypothetical protein [Kribbella jejuensis]TQJ19450.1 hypothetical protein FB475_3618 [Kribbella jejuensis]
MPKLTDDELGTLLRETFTDREPLADHEPFAAHQPFAAHRPFAAREPLADRWPEATKRRSPVPILLAAAAVVAVLAGVLYGVGRAGTSAPEQPAAAATPGTRVPARTEADDARIWAASLNAMIRTVRPPAGWRSVIVLDPSDVRKKGPAISRYQRLLIVQLVHAAPVDFPNVLSPIPSSCRDRRTGGAEISEVVQKGEHVEVEVVLHHDCSNWTATKYRVDKHRTGWVVTATLSTRSWTR